MYLLLKNSKYESFYKNAPEVINGKGVIIGEAVEKEYSCIYTIKVKNGKYKNKKFLLSTNKNIIFEYGDLIEFEGEYIIPSKRRNYKGFDYREYLKTKGIYGTIKVSTQKIKVLEKSELNMCLMISNKARNIITQKIKEILPNKTSSLLIGILLGNKEEISEEIIEQFKISNLSHILSVSGAHTSYIIIGISYILNKSKTSKKWIYIITIIALILFMFITNFTPSVIRACLMGILLIASKLLYCKTDSLTSISVCLLITLILNPFSINDIGLQLSYLGTLGIILFNKGFEKLFCKIKIRKKFSQMLSITFSAQSMILPIMVLNFNTVSLTFWISNILATPILGAIMILGFIMVFTSLISYGIAKMLAILLNLFLETLICISNFASKIPLSTILVKTPYIFSIILIYFFIFISNYMFEIYHSKNVLRLFQRKIINLINRRNILRIFSYIVIIVFILNVFNYILNYQELKIYFVDVGQGDCTLIVTPSNKKILIDGGQADNILLSYLLDRRIKILDYIIISHFDSDHVEGLLPVLEKLKVRQIIISKQIEASENYENFLKIVKEKRINVKQVKKGDKILIEKNLYINVIWPSENQISENLLNNNSIVCKLNYYNFSVLFTGDIEQVAEERILQEIEGELLSANILKVAHHGSNTSSTKKFIEKVKPEIALIGVGENNKFNHPNIEVLNRLNIFGTKVYRTDKMGEIQIIINNKLQKMNILSKYYQ